VKGLAEELARCTGFQWDAGNAGKNRECEQVFFQRPIRIAADPGHSQDEPRFAALGRTAEGRRLTVVFTIRDTWIRVISARPMSRRERRLYERT